MADEVKKEGDDDKGYKPQFDIVEEGTDGAAKTDDKKAKPGYEDDARLSTEQRADDDATDDDDTAVAVDEGNQTTEEVEAKRERRRRERKAQKARQNDARQRDSREMNFLRTRNEQLEKRFGAIEARVQQSELTQVDSRMEQLKGALNEAEEVLARAVDAGNGSDVVKLQRTIRELEAGMSRLKGYKHTLAERAKAEAAEDESGSSVEGDEGQARGAPAELTKVVKNNLQTFAKRHPWFDLDAGDEDSLVVQALDNAVKRDGFNPASKDYWVELEERMKRRLPERMKSFGAAAASGDDADDDDEPAARGNGKGKEKDKPKGGPRMPTGSQTRPTSKQFLLSAERKQAMIEAGVWDDPELRDKYITSYAAWDKANPAQSGR